MPGQGGAAGGAAHNARVAARSISRRFGAAGFRVGGVARALPGHEAGLQELPEVLGR